MSGYITTVADVVIGAEVGGGGRGGGAAGIMNYMALANIDALISLDLTLERDLSDFR